MRSRVSEKVDSVSMKENSYLQKALSILTSIGLAVSGWFLNSAYDSLQGLERRVQQVELFQAQTNGNRFTSGDFVKAKETIDTQFLAQDRRITILEENLKTIRDILLEMKEDIKELKTR